ncbi:hypothetical protein RBB79_14010 [Tunturiibacter empetritectus]|uniref:Uncharacterized protein n=1 Tax=Tunturiibacter lichenicola TaxID=2051959 RepID=A0A852VHQ6_9BACT|nr:hypothetical protein [Edaphobacter lichenicola]NYF90721.1 hypothetical protein [Edaphobacter lichenicola]
MFREIENRKPDWEMCSAIVAGVLGVVFLLPFLKAASEYSGYYYIKSVSGHIVSHSYMWMLISDLNISKSIKNDVQLLLIFVVGLLIGTVIYQTIRGKCELPNAELVFLILISAVPLFGYVLAVLVTHVLETRFVLGAVVGLLSLLAIGMSIVFKRRLIVNAVMVALFVTSLVSGAAKIKGQRATTRKVLEWLVLPNETKDALHARQGQPVYLANWDVFASINYYTRDPEIRKQFAMFYSMSLEKSCCGTGYDTMTRTMLNTQNITHTIVQSYEDLIKEPGEHLVYLPKSEGDWEWTRKALFASHAQMRTLGPMLDGDLVSVISPSGTQ